MSLLSYVELVDLVAQGVITGVKPECIIGASIDVHLGDEILAEAYGDTRLQIVDLSVKPRESVQRDRVLITDSYYDMGPFSGILAHTVEKFYLPNNIVGEYYLNSSLARNHLEHLHAGHCDPGWNGSSLTLELINLNRFHTLRLRAGQRIGQVLLYKVTEVPEDRSYATIGNYNGDETVGRVKGK
jgi:dCTP deaminase